MKTCCVLGSTNRAKYLGARRALSLIGINKIYTVKIQGLKPQPIGVEEIVQGAYTRAMKAYKYKPECYGLGVEAGIVEIGGKHLSGQIAVITDGVKYSIGTSSFFPLPDKIINRIRQGMELGVAIEEETGAHGIPSSIGAVGYYTKGFMTRVDLSYQAVLSAIIPLLNNEW